MIDYPQDTEPVGIPGIPPDVAYIGDRIDAMRLALERMVGAITEREFPRGKILELTADNAGGNTARQEVSSLRMLTRSVIVDGGRAAGVITVLVGMRPWRFNVSAAQGATEYHLPIPIAEGANVSAQHSAAPANFWGVYIIGYPDE